MLLGGAIATYKKPSKNVQSIILHFAAGVIFSVVAVEILPDIVKEHQPCDVVLGFTAGVIVMLLVSRYADKKSAEVTSALIPWSLLVPIAIDIFIDGLLLGIGFAAGATEGILLAIALSLELLSLGVGTASALSNENIFRKKSLFIVPQICET